MKLQRGNNARSDVDVVRNNGHVAFRCQLGGKTVPPPVAVSAALCASEEGSGPVMPPWRVTAVHTCMTILSDSRMAETRNLIVDRTSQGS